MLNFLKKMFKKSKEITLEDRVQDMQIDLKHMKNKLDAIEYYMQRSFKDGLKVKVVK